MIGSANIAAAFELDALAILTRHPAVFLSIFEHRLAPRQ